MALLTRIKTDPRSRCLPAVIATADEAAAVAAHALALAADDVFVLPIEDSELFARIRRCRGSRRWRPNGAGARRC